VREKKKDGELKTGEMLNIGCARGMNSNRERGSAGDEEERV